MILEEFMQNYDPKAKYKYIKDLEGIQLLAPHVVKASKFIHTLNPRMASTKEPKARQDLPMESQNEGIHCNTCHYTLPIRRERPKIASRLSNQYSQYIPQPLSFCTCRASAVEVDTRGRLRVYGDTHNLALVNYLAGFPIHHQLSNQKHAEIAEDLLEHPSLTYEPVSLPRYLWKTNFIDLTFLTNTAKEFLLPTEPTGMPKHLYYQAYAYRYKIAILHDKYFILPNGILVEHTNPHLRTFLDTPIDPPKYVRGISKATKATALRSVKDSYQILKYASDTIVELVAYLSDKLNVPHQEPKEHYFQLIGHLQHIRLGDEEPHKGYLPLLYKKALTTVRNMSRTHLRFITIGLPYSHYFRSLPPPPPATFLYTQRVNRPREVIQRVNLYKRTKQLLPICRA